MECRFKKKTCEITNKLFLAPLCSQLLWVMSVFLIILLLSETGAGFPPALPGVSPHFSSNGVSHHSRRGGREQRALFAPCGSCSFLYVFGVLHLISSQLPYGLCTWFTPGSSDTPAAHSGYRLNGCAMLQGLCLSFSPFDFYQAADGCKHSPILMLQGVFLQQLFPH